MRRLVRRDRIVAYYCPTDWVDLVDWRMQVLLPGAVGVIHSHAKAWPLRAPNTC